MQNKFLVYISCFMLLVMIFLSINYIKISNSNNLNSITFKRKIDSLERQYKLLDKKFSDQIYFSLDDNQEALRYLNDVEVDSLTSFIRDELYEKNFTKNSDFFIPLSSINNKYLINKVKILNHKWIIADFSNGSRWGEMWIEYHFNNKKVVFYVKDYFLY